MYIKKSLEEAIKAKEKLELLAKNENELIREYAIKQLNRHDFTDKDVEEQD